MDNIPAKQDGIDELPAVQFNSINDEMRNVIEKTAQTIPGPQDQMIKSMSNLVAMGDFYTDEGATANSRILNRVNPIFPIPTSFFDGLRVRFFSSQTNDGTGTVTVSVDSLGVKDIKMLDGLDLVSGEIVQGELYELTFRFTENHFIISSSSNSRMITENKTITVGAGQQFSTFFDAVESVRNQYILDNVLVRIKIIGKVTETQTTTLTHSEGSRIIVEGELFTTVVILSANNASGSPGAYSVTYTLSTSVPGFLQNGDYVIIHDTTPAGSNADKEHNRKHEGVWKVTGSSGVSLTVENTFRDPNNPNRPLAADIASGNVTFLPSRLDFTTDSRLFVDSTFLGGLNNLILSEADGLANSAILKLNKASVTFEGFLGVPTTSGASPNAINLNESTLSSRESSTGYLAATGDEGLRCKNSSIIVKNSLITNGCESQGMDIEATHLDSDVIIVCGNVSTVTQGAISVRLSSQMDADTMIVLTNQGLGIHVFNASALTVNTLLLSADNDGGINVEGSSHLTGLGDVKAIDNDQGTGANFGLFINFSSSCRIEIITITGSGSADIEVQHSSSARFLNGGNFGTGAVSTGSSVLGDVDFSSGNNFVPVGNGGVVQIPAITEKATYTTIL